MSLSIAALCSCGGGQDGVGGPDKYNPKFLFGNTTGGVVNFYDNDRLVASYSYTAADIIRTGFQSFCSTTPTTLVNGQLQTSIHRVNVTEVITRDKHDITFDGLDNNPTNISVTYTGSPENRRFAPDAITGNLPGNVSFTHVESISY